MLGRNRVVAMRKSAHIWYSPKDVRLGLFSIFVRPDIFTSYQRREAMRAHYCPK